MKKLSSRALVHALYSIAAGLAVFLGEVAKINPNPYVQAGCAAAIVALGGIGIGKAFRS